jgi:hypothetical protein
MKKLRDYFIIFDSDCIIPQYLSEVDNALKKVMWIVSVLIAPLIAFQIYRRRSTLLLLSDYGRNKSGSEK